MYQRQVTFQEAVVKALKENYCNFSGRASRSEFWWYFLFTVIVGIAVEIVFCWSYDVMTKASRLLVIALLLPNLGIGVRRLHDIGKSGWWWLLSFIPLIGAIILIIWWCQNSQMQSNEYGPVPNMVG